MIQLLQGTQQTKQKQGQVSMHEGGGAMLQATHMQAHSTE